MKKEFLIFEKGKYPQGDYSNIDVLTEFVNRFNETKIRIACFVGHRFYATTDEDELAHGEITELRINQKGQIFAVDYEFDDYLKEKIAKKQLLYVSPEIIGDPQKQIDITGVAFLGRTPPQNPYAILPAFFSFLGIRNKEQIKEESNFVGYFNLQKDFVTSLIVHNKEDNCAMTQEEKALFEKMQKELEETKKIVFALSKNFKNDEENTRLFFENLVKEGRLTPVLKDKFVSFALTLTDDRREEFKNLIADNLPKLFDLSGHVANREKKSDELDVVSKIKLFQKENNIKSFYQAAKLYYEKNPSEFKEEV